MTTPPPAVGARPRRFDRRPGLPSGRSLLGGLLVATAALGAFAVARGDAAPVPPARVVARAAVAPGESLTAEDLGLAPVALPEGDGATFASIDDLVGSVALAPLAPGDLVQHSAVLDEPVEVPAAQVSFPIDAAAALSGRLRLGERVDVVATFGTGVDAHTRRVAADALVVAVDAAEDRLDAGLVVTAALADPDDVLRVTHAVHAGSVTLVRTAGSAPGDLDVYRAPDADGADGTGSDR